ncbi:MAG: cupin domain-containing protein [Ramlibacter sp.]|nr:cupin domain-containing protein [Ramlibacter sp.]
MSALQTASAAAMFIVAGFVPAVSPAQGGGVVIVAPADLKWADVPSLPPGAKIAVIEGAMSEAKPFTVRLKFPANYKIPAHSHPAVEHVTVMSGTFHLGAGDKLDPKQTRALTPGSVAVMQPNTRHFAWTDAETIVQLHGMGPWGVAYAAPADDPRKN